VNVWRVAECVAVLCLCGGPTFAQHDPAAAEANTAFERGRYDLAWAATEAIVSDELRASWRFHVLYHSGNLAGALEEALVGLRAAPQSQELLQNALICSLTLGLGERSAQLRSQWRDALDRSALADEAKAAWETSYARYAPQVDVLLERDGRASSRSRTARSISLSIAAGVVLLALLVGVRRRSRPSNGAGGNSAG
jgi:hypothetical protein